MPAHLEPGPDHPIAITPSSKRWRVKWNGRVIAESSRVLDLKEASYPVVRYFPREDADMTFFTRTDRATHCPYKGDAAYFSLTDGPASAPNAVWTYETPFPAMAAIAGHLAFYPDKGTIEQV